MTELSGEPGALLPNVTEVQRLHMGPGDTLVLHLDATHVSMDDADLIKRRVQATVGDVPVLILAAGHSAEVIHKAAT
jgi:hypothetical protein